MVKNPKVFLPLDVLEALADIGAGGGDGAVLHLDDQGAVVGQRLLADEGLAEVEEAALINIAGGAYDLIALKHPVRGRGKGGDGDLAVFGDVFEGGLEEDSGDEEGLVIDDGLVERRSYNEIPPRVEYSLTERGRSVLPILQSICQWSGASMAEEADGLLRQCQRCDYIRKA